MSVASCRACGKLMASGRDAGRVCAGAGELTDGLVDGEPGPHLLGDAPGVLAARHRLALTGEWVPVGVFDHLRATALDAYEARALRLPSGKLAAHRTFSGPSQAQQAHSPD